MPFPAHADRSLNEQAPVRVMLVDDSAVVRGLLRKFIDPVEDIEVVTTAANGEVAVATLKRNPVDIIVLDIEMPVMEGLTAIPGLPLIVGPVTVIEPGRFEGNSIWPLAARS